MNLLHVDASTPPAWMIDGHAAAGNDSRRHFLSRFDIGTDLQSACVQPGLNFALNGPLDWVGCAGRVAESL